MASSAIAQGLHMTAVAPMSSARLNRSPVCRPAKRQHDLQSLVVVPVFASQCVDCTAFLNRVLPGEAVATQPSHSRTARRNATGIASAGAMNAVPVQISIPVAQSFSFGVRW
jgi:hypothetical protein